ncbi:hypothetical protein [Pantoea sp. GM01]|uniref:hypothetical protein n=1 Tax=Pantoea sp. GM01 TaxID=1144320 RepID=UPI000271077D|nr:hypothetical protein [Pantoea sp. GM01]EJL90279.1 hypothetical protein PMI17_01799 [Pantoea sp. GM01]
MTVSTVVNHEQYDGNGTTTVFPYRFRILKDSHMVVTASNPDGLLTTLVLGTDYTITGVGLVSGGSVVLNSALATGWQISLDRDLPAVQETDLRNQGKFFAETHEDAFDYLTMLVQRALSVFGLALRKPSWIAKYYDAQGNRIANLGDPINPQDASTKAYTDSVNTASLNKTLRVPEVYVAPLPSITELEGKVIGFVGGKPVGVPVPSGSAADVLIQLAKNTGSALIGTNHRGTLASDLNAIDRRPDGYGNSIENVLANGKDVQIEKDISQAFPVILSQEQVFDGAGGKLNITSQTSSGVLADARSNANKDFIRISSAKLYGTVIDSDGSAAAVAAYGAFLRDLEYPVIDGLYANGFTGGVANINTVSSVIKNVRATNTVYHPTPVRGGYGVFLDETRQAIIDGVQFDASSANNGRHMLYVSRGGGGNTYDGCQNTLAVNMIGKYRNKDNRDFWGINVRKSTRTLVGNTIIEGAPGGVSYNVENGYIEKSMLFNLSVSVLKYQNGVGVYGVTQTYDASDNKVTGFLDSGLSIEVKPKDSTVNGSDCIGYSVAGTNGRIANLLTNISTAGTPILIQPGTKNVIIDGVLDYTSDNSSETLGAMITFTGGAGLCDNITVRGVKTPRKMFARLTGVTNLTVDYTRQARITVASGVATKFDDHELISTITLSSTAITIVFNAHATQKAIEDASVRPIGAYQVFMSSTANKTLVINTYTITGAVLNPLTTAISLGLVLYS